MRLSRLTTHIVSLPLQDLSKKGHEKMEIKCVNCGRRVNLDHAVLTCPPKTGPDFVIVFWDNLGRK